MPPPAPAAHQAQHGKPNTKALSRAFSQQLAGIQPVLFPGYFLGTSHSPGPGAANPTSSQAWGHRDGRSPAQGVYPSAHSAMGHTGLKRQSQIPAVSCGRVASPPVCECPILVAGGGWLPWRTSWAWGWGRAEHGCGAASGRRSSRWRSWGSRPRSTATLSETSRREWLSPAEPLTGLPGSCGPPLLPGPPSGKTTGLPAHQPLPQAQGLPPSCSPQPHGRSHAAQPPQGPVSPSPCAPTSTCRSPCGAQGTPHPHPGRRSLLGDAAGERSLGAWRGRAPRASRRRG